MRKSIVSVSIILLLAFACFSSGDQVAQRVPIISGIQKQQKVLTLSELLPSEAQLAAEMFRGIFTDKCNSVPDSDDLGRSDTTLYDSLDKAANFCNIEPSTFRDFAAQKWLDDSRFIVKLGMIRKPDLTDAVKASLRFSAKMLTIFMLQTYLLSLKVENKYPHLCLEFIIRAAPRSKYYDQLFQFYFHTLDTGKKKHVLDVLLDTFNPDDCRFFYFMVGSKEVMALGKTFFKAWYQKLADCNFEGKDVERHLALLTSSLVSSTLGNTEEEEDGDNNQLIYKCMQRVSIPLMMSVDLSGYLFAHLLAMLLRTVPDSLLQLFIDRFLCAEVIASVPKKSRIVYGQIYAYFWHRNEAYSLQKLEELPEEIQLNFSKLVEELNAASDFVDSESEFLSTLQGPISKWKEVDMVRAAAVFEYVSDNVEGVSAIDTDLGNGLQMIVTRILSELETDYVPREYVIVDYVRLLFALIHARAHAIHVTNHLADDLIRYLTYFNKSLWPIIERNDKMVEIVRSSYPFVYKSIETVLKSLRLPWEDTALGTISSTVRALSPTPSNDLNHFIEIILDKDFYHFESAVKAMATDPDFDPTPFFMALLKYFNAKKRMTEIERVVVKLAATLLLQASSLFSISQLRLLHYFKSL